MGVVGPDIGCYMELEVFGKSHHRA
ncbi:hypothetical protein CCAND93_2880001 [Capnocytophaga canis]|uniref:Uncharacterized protein n=1 Tax=Capnocytophaga canis TaxID=1848903 RepID=A0A0B7ILJ9_9FLAO|nr:hypothetical protein CCAND93_2880001 [Capnocytophaga canis]